MYISQKGIYMVTILRHLSEHIHPAVYTHACTHVYSHVHAHVYMHVHAHVYTHVRTHVSLLMLGAFCRSVAVVGARQFRW